MPGEKICQPGNPPSEKSLVNLMKGLLIINNFQHNSVSRSSPESRDDEAGTFEIGPFIYILKK